MTTDSMTLIQAVQQVGDADLLRQLAQVALRQLMAFAVEGVVGVANGPMPLGSEQLIAMATASGPCTPAGAVHRSG